MAENAEVKNEEVLKEKKTTTKKAPAKKATKKTTTGTKKTSTKKEADSKETAKKTTTTKKTTTKSEGTAKKTASKTTGKKENTTKEVKPKTTKTTAKKGATKGETTEKSTTKKTTTAKKNTKTESTDKTTKPKKEETKKIEQEENIEEVAATSVVEEPETAIKIEDIKKTIKNKKKIPIEEMYEINKVMFKNILMAVAVIVYFLFLNLGFLNIENGIYLTDLKVFSICVLLLAIALIESAYKKDKGELAIFGIEMVVVALTTISLIYVNLMLSNIYVAIAATISFIFAVYYLVKTIIIYEKRKKQYYVNDMKDIINPEE